MFLFMLSLITTNPFSVKRTTKLGLVWKVELPWSTFIYTKTDAIISLKSLHLVLFCFHTQLYIWQQLNPLQCL